MTNLSSSARDPDDGLETGRMPDVSEVLRHLRQGLANGALASDGRVRPERQIADDFGVPRRLVREALAVLESEGIVWRRQGQGTFLSPPPPPRTRRLDSLANHVSPLHIMEVRMELEPVLARLAALRATPAEIETIGRVADRCRDAANASEYERWDTQFHRKIAEAAHNRLFLVLFENVRALRGDPYWIRLRETRHQESVRRQLGEEHRAIARALAQRDPEGAETAMRAHLRAVNVTMTTLA